MLLEWIKLLAGLYWSPLKTACRIIDEGRLWFAVFAAWLWGVEHSRVVEMAN